MGLVAAREALEVFAGDGVASSAAASAAASAAVPAAAAPGVPAPAPPAAPVGAPVTLHDMGCKWCAAVTKVQQASRNCAFHWNFVSATGLPGAD